MKHPIPDAALDDRLGFLGMTGSGKTFAAGTCVERILHRKGRVIIPDPLGVWWGLRLLADGKTASPFDIVIFGGPHGDLPLTPHAGALVGEAVASMRESAVIDLSQFETAASERRFMLAFLDALYRKSAGEPVHIVFDEGDMWAPERIVDRDGEATKLHGMMQNVVRRGRIKGLTSWLISQRPAALSKNVLSQVDGLVAFRLTASQDRKALGLWIEGQADREAGKAILGRLPEKRQGEAVVWLPQRGVLSDVTFPMKETYDSSRAPKRGEARRSIELQPLNLDALKGKLATVEAEVKANDPKALRAEIARLNSELTKAAKNIPQNIPAADPKAIEDARGDGFLEGTAAVRGRLGALAVDIEKTWDRFRDAMEGFGQQLDALKDETKQSGSPPRRIPAAVRPPERAASAPARKPLSAVGGNGAHATIEKPLQRIIDAIRWWNVLGVPAPSHAQVGFVASYSHKSGTFATYLSRLRSEGLIEGRGDLVLTSAGQAVAHEPDTPPSGDALRSIVLAKIDGPLRRIMTPIIESYPDGLSHIGVGNRAEYSHQSGTFATYLSRLRSLDLIEGRGDLRAQEWLFPT